MAKVWSKRVKGQWVTDVSLPGGGRRRLFLGSGTKAEAESALHEEMVKLQKEGGLERVPARQPVKAAANDFLEHVQKTRTQATYEQYRHGLRRLVYFAPPARGLIGERPISDIGPADLEAWRAALMGEGLSGTTVNAYLSAARRLFNWLVYMERLDVHRLGRVRNGPASEGRVRWLTTEELRRLTAGLDPDLADIVSVLVNTGLRCSELCRLTAADVDLERRHLRIMGDKTSTTRQNARERFVPVNAAAAGILERRQPPEGVVFRNEAGTPWTKDTLGRRLKRALGRMNKAEVEAAKAEDRKAATIEGVTLHVFRHTFASHLVQRGVPLHTVGKLLGHTSSRQTEIYAHLAPGHLQDAVGGLDYGLSEVEPGARSRQPRRRTGGRGKRRRASAKAK